MMSDQKEIENWIRERSETSPRIDEDFSAGVMERVRQLDAVPSMEEKIVAMVQPLLHRLVPERRREMVYLGGSAFAGVLRVSAIFYFVLGAF